MQFVQLMGNISNLFLALLIRPETSSRHFYDLDKMTKYYNMLIFTTVDVYYFWLSQSRLPKNLKTAKSLHFFL